MEKMLIRKPLNLHGYKLKINNFMPNWKFILTIIFSIIGIFLGSSAAKGEWLLYIKLTEFVQNFMINSDVSLLYGKFFVYLLVPTVFAVVLFFIGLSVCGCFCANFFPMLYGFIISEIVYYFFENYSLKGLAFVVIMIIPYSVLSLCSLIMLCSESVSMSQTLLKTLGKSKRISDYNFAKYYKNSLRSYLVIILAVVIWFVMQKLFSSIFIF